MFKYSLTHPQIQAIYEATSDEFQVMTRTLVPNGALLDVGTGGGRYARYAASIGFDPVYGLDIDENRIRACKEEKLSDNLHFVVGDILIPPDLDIRFGTVVMMTDTFNFLSDKTRALRKCRDLLTPDGSILISCSKPTRARELYQHIYDNTVIESLESCGVTLRKLKSLLAQCAFDIETITDHTRDMMHLIKGLRR